MAPGSRKKYALDLNDIFAFPDGNNIPRGPPKTEKGESWVMFLEVAGFPPSRRTYATVDITGKWFNVVINTSNPSLDTVDFKRGYTLCILNAEPLALVGPNDPFYYRVDDISTVELLPVSLTKLWELNDSLRIRSDAGYFRMCLSCGNVSRLRCAKCHSRFCSKGCQRAGWPKHKPECRALGVLLRYNRTDWG
ncbi:hypothetical protein BGY98DRAFT_47634 [Russula aff. rugulosa BPL654]|nr:hypothetical protein BGY98DRAFT_47634 [Russula aff. rugulosa BPL654]